MNLPNLLILHGACSTHIDSRTSMLSRHSRGSLQPGSALFEVDNGYLHVYELLGRSWFVRACVCVRT